MAKAKTITIERRSKDFSGDAIAELRAHAQEAGERLDQAYATIELLLHNGEQGDGFKMAHGNVIDVIKAVKHFIVEAEERNNSVLYHIENRGADFT